MQPASRERPREILVSQRPRVLLVIAAVAMLVLGLAAPASAWWSRQPVAMARTVAIASPNNPVAVDVDMKVDYRNLRGAYVRTDADARSYVCNGCTANAGTIHVTLISGDLRSLRAVNNAHSRNIGCTACDTNAVAIQIVVADNRGVTMSDEGRAKLADIEALVDNLVPGDGNDFVDQMVDYGQQAMSIVEKHSVSGTGGPTTLRGGGPEARMWLDID